MGQKLGCGAHLAEITRTAVGEFSMEQAITLEELAGAKQAGKFADRLIPLGTPADEFSASECFTGGGKARTPRHKIQHYDRAASPLPRRAAPRRDVAA